MFIGHFGVGYALKKADKSISLGWLILASQWVDIVWGFALLIGLERMSIAPGITKVNPLDFEHYPYTHSFLASCFWSVLAYVVFRYSPLIKSADKAKSAVILASAVFSHWILDLIVHRPDLPMGFSESPKFGFGVWNSLAASAVIEIGLLLAGYWLYLNATKAKSSAGKYGMHIFILCLLIIYTMSLIGPPPPSVNAVALSGGAGGILFVLIAGWLDKKRTAV